MFFLSLLVSSGLLLEEPTRRRLREVLFRELSSGAVCSCSIEVKSKTKRRWEQLLLLLSVFFSWVCCFICGSRQCLTETVTVKENQGNESLRSQQRISRKWHILSTLFLSFYSLCLSEAGCFFFFFSWLKNNLRKQSLPDTTSLSDKWQTLTVINRLEVVRDVVSKVSWSTQTSRVYGVNSHETKATPQHQRRLKQNTKLVTKPSLLLSFQCSFESL